MLESLPIAGIGLRYQVIDLNVGRYVEGEVPVEIAILRTAPFLYLRETVISHNPRKGIAPPTLIPLRHSAIYIAE
jgi:hypothetical protein